MIPEVNYEDILINEYSQGRIFGELSLLNSDGLRMLTARASETSYLLVIHKPEFDIMARASI